MNYRLATTSDIPELVKKRIEYWVDYYNGRLPKDYLADLERKLIPYFERNLNQTILAYVATEPDDKVRSIAMLLITEMPPRPSCMNGRFGTILNVYTEADYRRRGISEKLLRMLLDDAHAARLDHVELTATAAGYPLYKKLGFHEPILETKPMKLILQNVEF